MYTNIFIDGSCLGNPGLGGIGIYMCNQREKLFFAIPSRKKTTNNRMEVSAFIFAIQYFYYYSSGSDTINFFTDSTYLVLGWNSVEKWRARNWMGKNNKTELLNVDLWLLVLKLKNSLKNIFIQWIPREKNKIANNLAQKASLQYGFYFKIEL